MPITTLVSRRPGACPAARRGRHRGPHLPTGCRCLVTAAPTHQFLRALCAVGWPLGEQSRLVGASPAAASAILARPLIERATALRYARLYTRLWDVPGPSLRVITTAARLGWQAPDPVVVARLVAGTDTPHTPVDREQAVRVLAARGATTNAIAVRLGIRARTAARILATATPPGSLAA